VSKRPPEGSFYRSGIGTRWATFPTNLKEQQQKLADDVVINRQNEPKKETSNFLLPSPPVAVRISPLGPSQKYCPAKMTRNHESEWLAGAGLVLSAIQACLGLLQVRANWMGGGARAKVVLMRSIRFSSLNQPSTTAPSPIEQSIPSKADQMFLGVCTPWYMHLSVLQKHLRSVSIVHVDVGGNFDLSISLDTRLARRCLRRAVGGWLITRANGGLSLLSTAYMRSVIPVSCCSSLRKQCQCLA